jgi:hypothetical protein
MFAVKFFMFFRNFRLMHFTAEVYAYAKASAYKGGRRGYAEEYFVLKQLNQLTPCPSLEREGCPGGNFDYE